MSETPRSSNPKTGKSADETHSWKGTEGAASGDTGTPDSGRDRAGEWLAQLQSMIDNVATHAGPVARQIGAKAAELAAIAGEKAGPIAHKAAEVTAAAGEKVAERGRDLAADLRREPATNGQGSGAARSGTVVSPPETAEDAPRE